MRNLKRALSLTLASVMLLGMMVFGTSAASFTDADQISNVTAATVLQELEVMQGSNGKFSPNQTVTRGQMAILICKMLYGSKLNADNFAGTSEFTDVPANAYYTGYVNLASQLGIISGYGNGKFGPGAPVTTAQAALMLTKALGWFQAGELENQSWTSNAIAAVERATTVNLFGDLKLANNDPLSRDNVAEMVFNAMTKTAPVKYNERWGMYYSDEGNIVSGVKFDYRNTLGYTNFDLVYNDREKEDDFGRPSTEWGIGTVNGSTDDKGNIVSSTIRTSFIKAPNAATATYSAEVKGKDLYKDLALDKTTAATLIVNGRTGTDFSIVRNSDTKLNNGGTNVSGNGILVEAYKDEDNNVTIVVIDTYVGEVGTVVKATSSADRYVTLRNTTASMSNVTNKFETEGFATGDLVTFTMAYNGSKYELKTVEALDKTTTGTLTKWVGSSIVNNTGDKGTSNSSFDVDNSTYKYSAHSKIVDEDGAVMTNGIADFSVKKSEINVYLDKYGYAIYISGVEGEKNYAAVIGTGSTNPYGDQTTGVTLLMPDGTQKTVTAKVKNISVGTDNATELSKNTLAVTGEKKDGTNQLIQDRVGDLVSYTVDDNGVYELTLLGYDAAGDGSGDYTGRYYSLTKASGSDTVLDTDTPNNGLGGSGATNGAYSTFLNGKSQLTLGNKTFYTTDKTIFLVATQKNADASQGKGYDYNVYTGYANMPSFDAKEGITGYAYMTNSEYSGQIDVIYISAVKLAGVSAVDTYFVKKTGADITTDSDGVSYYTLPAIVDGEKSEVKVQASLITPNASTSGVWAVQNVIKNKDGIITSFNKVNTTLFLATNNQEKPGQEYVTGTVRDRNAVLGIGGGVKTAEYWAYTKDTSVYFVDKDYKDIWVSSIADIQTDANDLVYASREDNTNFKTLVDVIIVEQDDGTTPSGGTDAPGGESGIDVNVVALLDMAADTATPGTVTFVATGATDVTGAAKRKAIETAYADKMSLNESRVEAKYEAKPNGDMVYNVYVDGELEKVYTEHTAIAQLPGVPTVQKAFELTFGADGAPTNPNGTTETTPNWYLRSAAALFSSGFVSDKAEFTPTGYDSTQLTMEVSKISWNSNLDAKVPFFFYDPDKANGLITDPNAGNNYSIREAYLTLTRDNDGNPVTTGATKSVAVAANKMTHELNDKGITHFAIVPAMKADQSGITLNIIFKAVKSDGTADLYWQSGAKMEGGVHDFTSGSANWMGAKVTFKP